MELTTLIWQSKKFDFVHCIHNNVIDYFICTNYKSISSYDFYRHECKYTFLLFIFAVALNVNLLSFDSITQAISTWGVQNNIDFLSLSYTRHAEDVRHVRSFADRFYFIAYIFLVSPLLYYALILKTYLYYYKNIYKTSIYAKCCHLIHNAVRHLPNCLTQWCFWCFVIKCHS